MRKFIFAGLLASALGGFALLGAGCASDITISEFEVREDTAYIEIGESYQLPEVVAVGSDGSEIAATGVVTDADGNVLEQINGAVTPATVGDYTVTYTVTYNDGDTQSKNYVLNVFDLTAPQITWDHGLNIYAPDGGTFDLSTVSVSDNSGEDISPVIKVYRDGTELSEAGDTLTVSADYSLYTVEVSATDASENSATAKYQIFTVLDAENGAYANNPWYQSGVSDEGMAYQGKYSYKFGGFMDHPTWFDDASMLGDIDIVTEQEYSYLTFWICFDFEGAGYESATAELLKAYHDMTIYDVYGDEMKLTDEKTIFVSNTWFKIVVDLAANNADTAMTAIADSLNDFRISFGTWDWQAGSDCTIGAWIYIDDICLTNDPSSDYQAKPQLGEVLYQATDFGQMIGNVYDANKVDDVVADNEKWYTVSDESGEIGSYNFFYGAVEDLKLFDSITDYANWGSTLQTDVKTEGGWKFYYGNDTAFIYAFEAARSVYVGIGPAVSGNVKGTMDVYVRSADGTGTEETYSVNLTGAGSIAFQPVLLEAGETLYIAFNTPASGATDGGNVETPPVFIIYDVGGAESGTDDNEEQSLYEAGELLNDTSVTFGNLVAGVYDANKVEDVVTDNTVWGKLIATDNSTELGSYNFFYGSVEEPKTFDTFADYQTWSSSAQSTVKVTGGWEIYYGGGSSEAFIYAFEASARVFAGFSIPDNCDGWRTGTMTVYVKDSEGTLTKISSVALNGQSENLNFDPVLLEAGETLYVEISDTENTQSVNITTPPVFAIYDAVEKADSTAAEA